MYCCFLTDWMGDSNKYESGGSIATQNKEMLVNKVKEINHHVDELSSLLKDEKEIDSWVITKAQRAATDLADITHYLDGVS